MRREISEFAELYPSTPQPNEQLARLHNYLSLKLFAWQTRGIAAGSERWHLWQHRMSLESAVGLGMEKRLLFYRITLPQWGKQFYVLPNVTFNYPLNLEIGENVFVNRGAYITARAPISIGKKALIGPYVVINSGNHSFGDRSLPIRDQSHSIAPIKISDDVWIGAHATILPGVTLGEGSIVGAGAVVTRSVDPFTIVAGVPARPLKVRP